MMKSLLKAHKMINKLRNKETKSFLTNLLCVLVDMTVEKETNKAKLEVQGEYIESLEARLNRLNYHNSRIMVILEKVYERELAPCDIKKEVENIGENPLPDLDAPNKMEVSEILDNKPE